MRQVVGPCDQRRPGAQLSKPRLDEVVLCITKLLEGGGAHLVPQDGGVGGDQVALPARLVVPWPRDPRWSRQPVPRAHPLAQLLDVDLPSDVCVLIDTSGIGAPRAFELGGTSSVLDRTASCSAGCCCGRHLDPPSSSFIVSTPNTYGRLRVTPERRSTGVGKPGPGSRAIDFIRQSRRTGVAPRPLAGTSPDSPDGLNSAVGVRTAGRCASSR